MATANFEGYAFKLAGLTLGPGGTIPIGTMIDKVVLTTRDLVTGTTAAEQRNDIGLLLAGESASIQINGLVVATTVPVFRAAFLDTDVGRISVLVFSAGGNSYAVANTGTNFDAPNVTVAATVLNTNNPSGINPLSYGLQPEDANTYTAKTFNTQDFGGAANGSDVVSVSSTKLFDTDLIRGNGEFVPASYQEILATIQFTDGTVLGGVRALQTGGYSGYVTSFSYLFDEAALAASGHSINDVGDVLGTLAFDHNLDWDDLGFKFVTGPIVDGGGDDAPPPPPPPPPLVILNGTSRGDVLTGGSQAEAIRGFDGSDRLTGNGGNDVFIFGTDSRSGRRSTDTITDYQVGHDKIGLEGGASIKTIVDNGSAIVITLVGDGDKIVIQGAALSIDDITILDNPVTFDLM